MYKNWEDCVLESGGRDRTRYSSATPFSIRYKISGIAMGGVRDNEFELSEDVVSFRPHPMVSNIAGRASSSIRRDDASCYSEEYEERIEPQEDLFESIFDDDVDGVGSDEEGNNNDNTGSIEKTKSMEDAVSVREEHVVEYPEGGKLAYLSLFGCFIGLVAEFGLWNSTGAIESYIASHILVNDSDIAISMIFALFSFFVMFGTMISGVIFDKYGGKQLCYAGCLLTTGGLMATANCTKLYQFILAFGVTCGIGCSFLTAPFVTSIGHFFSKKRGMALSIAMPGASLGGVIWPLVCRSLYTKVGFAWTMRTLGFCIGFLLLTAAICIHDRHVEIVRIKRLNEGVRNMTFKEKINDLVDLSSFREVTFLVLTTALFLNEFSLLMVSTYIPSYALSKGFSESFSLIALTVFNAAGILGRIVPTFLSDRYGNFNLIILMSVIMTFSVWILWLPLGKYLGVFVAFTIIFGFAVAGTLALTPLCTSAISKPKDFGKRYGTAYFFVAFCNLISLPAGMALTETKAGYDAMVAFAGATCTLATFCFIYTRYRVGGLNKLKI